MRISKIVLLALVTAWLAFTQSLAPETSTPIVVQNMYWAKPGKAEEVYQWRLHASDVRVKLGLKRGRVLRRQGDSSTLPDVLWECEYPSAAERAKDVATTGQSAEFKQVQEHMQTLTSQFDRIVLQAN